MSDLIKVLMDRDEMEKTEAVSMVSEMRERILDGEDPEEVLLEMGLESDYVFDII